ncbi:MAG: DUF4139 domain-containing protein [Acidobacteria bacterium]|nr:MAG: DUF4139 domain-containing protein [Acidobacteriota bacterium]
MKRLLLSGVPVLFVAGTVALAQAPAGSTAATQPPPAPAATPAPQRPEQGRLPVRRVVLYKNGVGFFEHVGKVRGSGSVSIDFTSAQLNDALKSLTTLDLGNGRITGISYNSDTPLARRLAALQLPLGQDTTVAEFLNALRGARLEVRTAGAVFTGRLLSVEKKSATRGDQVLQLDEFSIVTDAGEVRRVEFTPAVGIRILERELNGQVDRYLGLVASTRAQDLRRMLISTSGTGERDLYVSYISEVPVWKTTYRLVMPDKEGGKATLQGWAIVDNTVGEDWADVELSLVAGAPQSFIQQISQPFYTRRPVVPLPQSAMLTPQTHEGALTSPVEEAGLAAAPAMEKEEDRARTRPGYAGGVVGGVVGGLPGAPAPPAAPPMPRFSMAESVVDAAQGRELGDVFEYRVKAPITIRKNQSAMVPIVQSPVTVEKVSLWNEMAGRNPLRAAWLTNSTDLTLDGGSLAILEEETFAGEGLVEALKPGEKRFISYASDTAVLVDMKRERDSSRATRVTIAKGVMVQQTEERERRLYTIRNNDSKARLVVLEQPNRAEWKVAGTPQPDETSAGMNRFRVNVGPKASATLQVEERRPVSTRTLISDLTGDQVALMVSQQRLSPQAQQALAPIVAKRGELAAVEAEIRVRRGEIESIVADQSRLRENLKALKGTSEEKALVQRYTRQLDDQETRLDTLRREIAERERRQQQLRSELESMVSALAFEG